MFRIRITSGTWKLKSYGSVNKTTILNNFDKDLDSRCLAMSFDKIGRGGGNIMLWATLYTPVCLSQLHRPRHGEAVGVQQAAGCGYVDLGGLSE